MDTDRTVKKIIIPAIIGLLLLLNTSLHKASAALESATSESTGFPANDAKDLVVKGVALTELGKHDEAIKCFEKAIEIDPKYAWAWGGKGIALGELGRYDEAIKCYDKAIKYSN